MGRGTTARVSAPSLAWSLTTGLVVGLVVLCFAALMIGDRKSVV